jgi:hypothetical protein
VPKDRNKKEDVIIQDAATLRVELTLKPGLLPWFKQGLRLHTEIPIDLVVGGSITTQFEDALKRALKKFRVEVIDPVSLRIEKARGRT